MDVEFEEFDEQQMLSESVPEGFIEDLPTCVFPNVVCRFIEDMAYCYQCPKNFVVSAVLTAASAAIGNKVHIKDGKYDNPLMVWTVNVAKSGTNKTAPVRRVLGPLFDINRQMIDQYKQEKAKAKEGEPMPMCRQLIISDSTEEARLKVIHDNPNGILCYYPEIKGFFDDMGRYSASDGSSKLLRIFDGDDISVNRKTDENPWDIRNPFMSIIGDIQPDLLRKAFGDPKFLANGLNQRFLFCYEESPVYGLYSEEKPNENYYHLWGEFIKEFHKFRNPDNRPLVLDVEAKEEYIRYFNDLQIKKNVAKSDYERSVYSKCQIQVLRIAGLLHMFKVAPNLCYIADPKPDVELDPVFTIAAHTMVDAVEMMRIFEQTAMRIYAMVAPAEEVAANMSKTEIIRLLSKYYNISNIEQFARSIGTSRTFVSRIINSSK